MRSPFTRGLYLGLREAMRIWGVGNVLTVPYAVLVESRSMWDTWAGLIQLAPITLAFALSVVTVGHVVDALIR